MWLSLVAFLLAFESGSTLTYVATIDMEGVMGRVTFTPDGGNMSISVSINSNTTYTYSITEFPAVFGQQLSASGVCANLGSVLINLPGVSNDATTVVASLSEDTIFNRGLILADATQIICATILPVADNILTWRAMFIGPVVGDVWIRKRASLTGLFVCSDLAYATDLANPTANTAADLVQYSSGPTPFATRTNCSSLGGKTPLDMNVPIGNSVESPNKKRCTFVSTLAAVDGYMGIEVESVTRVCTNVQVIASKTVVATFSWDNIRGDITMTQASPFDVTTTTVQLSGLNAALLPAAYHVHKFPVQQRMSSSDQRCSSTNVAGHFNPYGAVVGAVNTTSDLYEIGDLSGKYGSITTSSYSENFTDWNLPLFGPNSVVGRSIVIHRSGGDRWICTNIGYPSASTTTAIVNFRDPVYGSMYFTQSTDNPDGDTAIYGELANMNGVSTQSHNFHVHIYPVGKDCASAGPHYNPSQVFTNGSYSTRCSPTNPLRCELGDLSGKLDTLDISTTLVDSTAKFFFTDSNLPLSGIFNIIGRSIVIHGAGSAAARYACANVTKLREVKLQSDTTWKGGDVGTVSGALTFTQASEYDSTMIKGSVSGLSGNAQNYSVLELPIYTSALGLSQCQTVGAQFNPFGVTTMAATGETFDKYTVGDLSGKYSSLGSMADVSLNKVDNNLPLGPAVGIAGRSVVIYDTSGQPWKCSTLGLVPSDGTGQVVTADVLFTTGPFVGYLKLTQVVYDDGSASPTTIEVSLLPQNAVASPNHNWHVHIDPIQNQTSCSIAKGHYNPYNANVSAPSYSHCSAANPLACEVGDLSKKHAQYTVQTSGRKLFVDADLPLHTSRTVLGRSIVFHAANGGAPRVACANILPTSQVYTLQFPISVDYDYYRFTKAVSAALGIARMRVIVLHNVVVPVSNEKCSAVMVHIAGTVDAALIDAMLKGTASELGVYTPSETCKSVAGATAVGLTALPPPNGAPAPRSAVWIAALCSLLVFFQHL